MCSKFKPKKSKALSLLFSSLVVAIAAVDLVHAAPVVFNPYISADATYDDNLFRLSSAAADNLGVTDLSDDYYKLAAGSLISWQHQRQKFNVEAEVNRNVFNKSDTLDYTGGILNAKWDWVSGRLWSGKVSYAFNRELKSFSNMLVPRRDIKTSNRLSISGDRKLDERWFSRIGGQLRKIQFSDTELNEREEAILDGGLFYKSHANNTTGFRLKITKATFPNRSVDTVRLIDDGYLRSSLDAITRWVLSGKSKINAQVGYTRQDQNNISSDNFGGLTGRLVHTWTISRKTKVESSIWRELSTLSDEISNYAVVTGLSVIADWKVANKTLLNIGAEFENRDYKEGVDLIDNASFVSRDDDVLTYWAGLSYTPQKNTALGLTYENGTRDSNRVLREYDYYSILGSIKVSF